MTTIPKRTFRAHCCRLSTILCAGLFSAALGYSVAQTIFDDAPTVSTLDDLAQRYLSYRDSTYAVVVPDWYLWPDQVEAIESQYGLAAFQNEPGWYWAFSDVLYFDADSDIAKYVQHNDELVIYEDMINSELVVVKLAGESAEEVVVYKSPEWPEVPKGESYAKYLGRELSKRRVVWRVTMKDKAIAEQEVLTQEEETEGGGIMMMISGGSCDEIVFTAVELSTNIDAVDMGLCFPAGITNVDIFWATNIMPEGFPWQFAATNLPVTTNSVVWSWTNLVGSNVFFAAADSCADTDGDGLPDGREVFVYGTDRTLWDTDGDSYSDGEELQWGTDPLDIQSMPRLGRGVVINEIVYNPPGSDTGNEWIELFNTNRVDVDLTDFRIQVASNAFQDVFSFPTGTVVNSGDFLLVGGSAVTNANHVVELNMINRFSFGPTAGVRLVSPDSTSNAVVDACLYAPTNTFGLPTAGFGTDGFAPYAAEGYSILRFKTGYDSDHASDWTFTNTPTPTASGELPDIDGDGISNSIEIAGYATAYGIIHTDFNTVDSDFDGLSDGVERTNGPPTNGMQYDTDGDAFPWRTNGTYRGNDGDEIASGTDPTNSDTDGDGLNDGWELAMGYNPTNTANGTADADADFDGDGVSNVAEMNQNSNPMNAASASLMPYTFRLERFPRASWNQEDDIGLHSQAVFLFDNILYTTLVCVVVADGGHTNEEYSVAWSGSVIDHDEAHARTSLVWATIAPGQARMLVNDNGTTWPNENPSEYGIDMMVSPIMFRLIDAQATIQPHGTSWISGTPAMPALTAECSFFYGPTFSAFTNEFLFQSTYPRRGTADDVRIPSSGTIKSPVGSDVDLEPLFSNRVFGGEASVTWQIPPAPAFTLPFRILGQNPSDADVETFITANQGVHWYAKAVAREEGGRQGTKKYNQFNELLSPKNEPNKTAGINEGWGIFQMDVASGIPITTDMVWNWKTNVLAGIAHLDRMRIIEVSFENGVQRTYPSQWESPPASFEPSGTTTPITSVEAGTLAIYNRAPHFQSLTNAAGRLENMKSCWEFVPAAPSGSRWVYHQNVRGYVERIITRHETGN